MSSEKSPLLGSAENGGADLKSSYTDNSQGETSGSSSGGFLAAIDIYGSDWTTPAPMPRKWTKKQMLTAASLSLMNFSLCISFGIISPFYPSEAAKKGASPTEVGLVFGVFQLILFITSPIYGSFIQQIGAKYMFLSGSFILGGCSIAFGFLDRCPDGPVFVAMCFISRSIEANGCAMLSTASFAIMASTFPNNVGSAIGTLEIFSGVGMVLGPSIGGGLYGLGGYTLPFAVIGGIVWVTTIISYFVLPSVDEVPKMTGSVFSLLKIPGCIIIYFVIFGCGMSLSFLDPTFSPWMLKTFKWVTVPQIGLIFMAAPGLYALSAPFAGFISDKGYQGSLTVVGLILTGGSFLLLGPSPLLQPIMPTTIPLTLMALLIMGVAIGAAIIPVFGLVIRLARNRGFEDNLQTYGIVSGYFQSGFSLGAFVGPTAAGYFANQYGFAWSSSICGFIVLGVAILMTGYIWIMYSYGKWPLPMPVENQTDSPDNEERTVTAGSVNA